MKMISIKQPWASLIVSGAKDVENRTWLTKYRGPVLVHASAQQDKDVSVTELTEFMKHFPSPLDPLAAFPLGGVIGMTEIVECVRPHHSKWYAGTYVDKQGVRQNYWAIVLANSRPLPFVQWKGKLGIRDAPSALLAKLQTLKGDQS